uniref:SCP domain-containing protein n=1 Tax=Leersia perrieri TaxID=77586 RepID=A0A0D9WV47_9ORYZ
MERVPNKSAAFAAVALAMAIFAVTATMAQEFTDDEKALFVQLHNDARADVAAGITMPAVSWDETLASYTMEQASKCQKMEQIPAGPYGENLWWGRSFAAD